MTITTPPQETRTRRPRRDDEPAPARPARRRPPPEAREDTGTSGAVRGRSAKTDAARPGEAKKNGAKKGPKPTTGKPTTGKPTTGKTAAAKTGAPGNVAVKTRAATTTERRRSATPGKPPPKAAPKTAPKTTRIRTAPAPRRSAAPPRAPFVLVVVGLLGGALVSLLLLNTVLAQDAFTLSELQRGNQQLSERKQALQEDINRENTPAVLHSKARGLGMVDSKRPAFIDARTGRVTESGTRPPGVSDEAMAAAAAAGVAGAPGAIMPPTGAPRSGTPRSTTPRSTTPRSGTAGGTAGGTR
jgi:hypothetical protein